MRLAESGFDRVVLDARHGVFARSRRAGLAVGCLVIALSASVSFAGGGVARAASLSWSGPQALTSTAGAEMRAVACPAATQCTAVYAVGKQGFETTFDPADVGAPVSEHIDEMPKAEFEELELRGLACASLELCTAIDNNAFDVSFNPEQEPKPVTPSAAQIDNQAGRTMEGIACTSAPQCTTVDQGGVEFTFDPLSPSRLDSNLFVILDAVACPSSALCVAVGVNGTEVTFVPPTGSPAPAPVGGKVDLTGVACPSTQQCTAVGGTEEVTFNPSEPGSVTPAMVDSGGEGLSSVACPSTTQCTAVDSLGEAVTFNPTAPGTPTPAKVSKTGLTSLACPSEQECVAVDTAGQAFVSTTGSSTTGGSGGQTGSTGTGTTGGSTSTPGPGGHHAVPQPSGAVAHGNEVHVTLKCLGSEGAPCEVLATISVTETGSAHKAAAATASHKTKPKHLTLVIGRLTASIPAGSTRQLTVKLNAAGRRLLAARHALRVQFALSQLPATGASASAAKVLEQTTLTLTAPHPRHKRH
jgi:hypothetical protein